MKERDIELTNQSGSPTLNNEREIFMPEPGQGDFPPKETPQGQNTGEQRPQRRKLVKGSPEALARARADVASLTPLSEDAGLDEKSARKIAAQGIFEGWGFPGMAGAEDAESASAPGPENAAEGGPREDAPARESSGGLSRNSQERERDINETEGRVRQLAQANGIPDEFVTEVLDEAKKDALRNAMQRGSERPITVPESLEDLAQLIMKRSDPEWRKDGPKSLIKADGRVNTVNFLDWARQNLLNVHNANPTDPVNFFSDIGTSVRTDIYGGTISFYEITFGRSFFLHDAGGGHKTKDDEYEELRNQVLMETFLLMLLRNPDITYMQGRGEKDKVIGAVSEAFLKNPITRGKFLEFILTLPSVERSTSKDLSSEAMGRELITKKEGNFHVGNATRRALAAYINIFDYGQLQKILGKDTPLFDLTYTTQKGETKGWATDIYKDGEQWFNSDGTVKLYHIDPHTGKEYASKDGKGNPHSKYMDYLNVFLSPTPSQTQQTDVRERIRLSLMKQEGISYREAELAELYAFSMTHIHGVSARNDTQSVAFDWWTRMTNFKDYRKRQKAEKRGAKYGNNYNLEGFKRIGLDYFEAARDVNNRSIREIVQGGTGGNIDMSSPIKDQVEFKADLQKQFVPNHLRTAAEMYDWIIDSVEMDFPSMVTGYDSHGNAIMDWKKVNEIKEKIEHDIRYSLSTWPEINFHEENVEWERVEVRDTQGRLVAKKTAKDGSPLYLDEDWYVIDRLGRRTQERDEPKTFLQSRKMTRLESMFGTDALKFIQYEIGKRGLATGKDVRNITDQRGSVDVDFSEAQGDSERFKIAVWRGAFDYLIASEIASHRDRGSGFRYYNYEDIKKAADAWRDAEFITPDEIKKIRKETGTRARRTYGEEFGYILATGGFDGLLKSFRIFMRDLFK